VSPYLRHELDQAKVRAKHLEDQLLKARAAASGAYSQLVDVQKECIWFREALRVLIDKAKPEPGDMVMRVDRAAYRKMHEMLYPHLVRTARVDFPEWMTEAKNEPENHDAGA